MRKKGGKAALQSGFAIFFTLQYTVSFQFISKKVYLLNGWTSVMLLLLLSIYLFVRSEAEDARFKKNFQIKKTTSPHTFTKSVQTTSV